MSEQDPLEYIRSHSGVHDGHSTPATIKVAGVAKAPRKMKQSSTPSSLHKTMRLAGAQVGLQNDSEGFSKSFKGFASRGDFLGILAIAFFVEAVCGAGVTFFQEYRWGIFVSGPLILLLLYFKCLYLLPCMCRRSFQMCGSSAFAWIVLAFSLWASMMTVRASFMENPLEMMECLYSALVFQGISLFFMLILAIVGGRFAGKKNALMVAAILGDMKTVKMLAPSSVLELKSEKGYTAREYAEMAGHTAIAAYLKEKEEEQRDS